jgi:antitoxin component YwqK of YwqJK toxin-antitoxin module
MSYFVNCGNFCRSNIKIVDGIPFTGEDKTFYSSGNIETVCTYKQGKLDGEFIKYYDASFKSVEIICYYNSSSKATDHLLGYPLDKVLEGYYREFYLAKTDKEKEEEHGSLKLVCKYKDNVLNGMYRSYSPDINVFLECEYRNGKIIGPYFKYDFNKNSIVTFESKSRLVM